MTQGSARPTLKLIGPTGISPDPAHHFELVGEVVKVGRSPDCQIRFDSTVYRGVSRYHVSLKAIHPPGTPPPQQQWQLCDEGSANGTFVNGQQIQGCVTLRPGDRIVLSQNGPQLIYDLPPLAAYLPETRARIPGAAFAPQPGGGGLDPSLNPSLSQLIPVVSTRRNFKDFLKKGYIFPGVITILWVVLLFVARGNILLFIFGLGTYLGLIGFSFIYRLCGKEKPWWEIACSTLFTMSLLTISLLWVPWFLGIYFFFFRGILPGNIEGAANNFASLFVAHFFGAGLSEELLKAFPVFLLMLVGKQMATGGQRRRIGVFEPLDGIVLGAASGLGFTLVETLVQYVPGEILRVSQMLGGSQEALQTGQLLGIQLLVPRIIGSVAGHMAYSGYFGYFIGLSVLYPSRCWQLLGIGYFTSSLLHALWNATGGTLGPIMLAFTGILAYVFLIAAILKARELSPTRSQNFATRIAPPGSDFR